MFPSWKVSKWTLENRIVIYCSKNSHRRIGGSDAGDSNGSGERERRENPPRRGRPPAGVVQHPPGPPRALPPVPPPRHEGTGAAAGVRAIVPEGTHPPGDESESRGADPGGAAGGLSPARSTHPAIPGEAPRGVSQDARPDLLQAGGPVARRLAQAEHGVRPSVLRGTRGGRGPRDRDGRGSMGIRPRPRDELLRPEGEGVHGPRVVRPEAVPEVPHEPVRGRGHPEPERPDKRREEVPGARPGPSRVA